MADRINSNTLKANTQIVANPELNQCVALVFSRLDRLGDWRAFSIACKAWKEASEPQFKALHDFALAPQGAIPRDFSKVVRDYLEWQLIDQADQPAKDVQAFSAGFVRYLGLHLPSMASLRYACQMMPHLRKLSLTDWVALQMAVPDQDHARMVLTLAAWQADQPRGILMAHPAADALARMLLNAVAVGTSPHFAQLLQCLVDVNWDLAMSVPVFQALQTLPAGESKNEAVLKLLAKNPPLPFLLACIKTPTPEKDFAGEDFKKPDYQPKALILAKLLPNAALANETPSARGVMLAVSDCVDMLCDRKAAKTARDAFFVCLTTHFAHLRPLAVEQPNLMSCVVETAKKSKSKAVKAFVLQLNKVHGITWNNRSKRVDIHEDGHD